MDMVMRQIIYLMFAVITISFAACSEKKSDGPDVVLERAQTETDLQLFELKVNGMLKARKTEKCRTGLLSGNKEVRKMVLDNGDMIELDYAAVNDNDTGGKFIVADCSVPDNVADAFYPLVQTYINKYGMPSFHYIGVTTLGDFDTKNCSFYLDKRKVKVLSNYSNYYDKQGSNAEAEEKLLNDINNEIFTSQRYVNDMEEQKKNLSESSNIISMIIKAGLTLNVYPVVYYSLVWEWQNQSVELSLLNNRFRIMYANRGSLKRKSIEAMEIKKISTEENRQKDERDSVLKNQVF